MNVIVKNKLLVLQVRNLGDAVITTKLIEILGHGGAEISLSVITRPALRRIFLYNPNISDIHVVNIPGWKISSFSYSNFISLIKKGIEIRNSIKPFSINTANDFRENAFGWLIGGRASMTVDWEKGHPMRHQVRMGLGWLNGRQLKIPKTVVNMYEVMDLIALELGIANNKMAAIYKNNGQKYEIDTNPEYVGLHPFASQPCREWTFNRWVMLTEKLVTLGYKVCIFGPPHEKERLELLFGVARFKPYVNICAGDFDLFFDELTKCRVLIGLDSFAVHAASAIGVNVVMLSGPNNPSVWAPPGSVIIEGGPSCPYYPCYNRPRCLGTSQEYICMTNISVGEVVKHAVQKYEEK